MLARGARLADRESDFCALAQCGMEPFEVGKVAYPIAEHLEAKLRCESVAAVVPMRLNSMLLDYSLFVEGRPESWWRAGSVAFGARVFTTIRAEVRGSRGVITVGPEVPRHSIVRHAALIVQKALNVNDGILVTGGSGPEQRHMGLGSSPCLQIATACAVHELYGAPIPRAQLIRYLVRNYGEEIAGQESLLMPVQSMGAAAAIALAPAGMVVVAGLATVIARMRLPLTHRFVIGVPRDYESGDSVCGIAADAVTYPFLKKLGKSAKLETAYDVLHHLLPAMAERNLKAIGAVIRSQRLSAAQVKRYEMRYPGRGEMLVTLSELLDNSIVDIASVSSTGPALFALTRNCERVAKTFEAGGFLPHVVECHNHGVTYIRS